MDATSALYPLYPCDLSESEWSLLCPLFEAGRMSRPGWGRPWRWSLRQIVDAVFYVVRGGIAWRLLPREYPPWQTVYAHFRRWRKDGTWERVHAALRERCRVAAGREATPSGAAMDAQSVRTTDRGGERGFDGFKKVSGRKRHFLTDTTGLLLKVKVHAANLHDSAGAKLLLPGVGHCYPRLEIIWADQGYRGEGLSAWIEAEVGATLTVVRRSTKEEVWQEAMDQARERIREGVHPTKAWAGISINRDLGKTYEHLPKRWVVERTFAWIGKNRRLSKDYEYRTDTSEALIYCAMIRLMLKRLTGCKAEEKGRNRPVRRAKKARQT